MDQSVMVFADSAARGSAIGTASAGMVTYLEDDSQLYVYTGASWDVVGEQAINFTSSTATAYTLASADAGYYLQFTNAATITVGTATDFTQGQQVQILADGTAMFITTDGATIAGAGTSTTSGTFTVGAQYEAVGIIATDTDTYRVIGNISAV